MRQSITGAGLLQQDGAVPRDGKRNQDLLLH